MPVPPASGVAQPFTPAGVAAFHARPAWWLAGWSLVVMVLGVFLVRIAWTGTWEAALDQAAKALPAGAGAVTGGQLVWSNPAPVLTLHSGPFLGVAVAPDDPTARGRTADVQLVLHRRGAVFGSLFGTLTVPYPPGLDLPLDAVTTPGSWAGWRGPVRKAVAVSTAVGLPAGWALLATAYAPLLWLWSTLLGRRATLAGCWRMAGAALMPGALLMLGALALYALGGLRIEGLLLAQPLHLLPGWILCLLAPRHLPPRLPEPGVGGPNPFAREAPAPTTADENPFRV
ncbi:MAG: hypothetical protein ACKVYV_17510 [Limisphaerales bacterium]